MSACAMQELHRLLVGGLDGHTPDVTLLGRHPDGASVGGIVLVPPHEGAHLPGWQQLYAMPHGFEGAGPPGGGLPPPPPPRGAAGQAGPPLGGGQRFAACPWLLEGPPGGGAAPPLSKGEGGGWPAPTPGVAPSK